MLIPFVIVLGLGTFFLYCAWRRAGSLASEESEQNFSSPAMSYTPFEQPSRWLAIRASNPSVVQAALHLHHPTPCSWEEGLAEAREDKLFISPAVSGWVLVLGSGLPEPAEDPDRGFHFLTALSRKLGQVQFFSVGRAVNSHGWVLMERGHVYRAYAWAGETLWNQGPVTAAEKDLKMLCLEYACERNPFTIRDALAANSEKVNQLAARWSVDPAAIPPELWRGRGIVGALLHSKPH